MAVILPLLSATELRAQCRVDDPDEDSILLAYAAAAERHVESVTGHVLTYRSEFVRDTLFPAAGWNIVRFPIHHVIGIEYDGADGNPAQLASTAFLLQPVHIGYQLRLRAGQVWPDLAEAGEVNIELAAGYPIGECPTPLKQACLLLAAHFYANREAVAPGNFGELPFAASALMAPYRIRII